MVKIISESLVSMIDLLSVKNIHVANKSSLKSKLNENVI